MTTAPKFRLRLSSLKFMSVVDEPCQPNSKTLLIKRAPTGDEISATMHIAKIDEELGLAFFWGFTSTNPDGSEHFDLANDTVDPDFVKAAMNYMLEGGAVDEMHNGQPGAGRVVFCMPITKETIAAFGLGDVKQTGLMIGLKPSPEVLAKLKSGEYTGVSLAGMGTRELLKSAKPRMRLTTSVEGHSHTIDDDSIEGGRTSTVTTADGKHDHPWVRLSNNSIAIGETEGHGHEVVDAALDDTAPKLAAHRAQLEKQAAQIAADVALEKKIVDQSLAYLDQLLADHGVEYAVAMAKRNATSIGNWGQVWLDSRADQITKSVEVVKATSAIDVIMKRRDDYDALVTKYMADKNCSKLEANEAVYNSDEGAKAYLDGWSSMYSSVEKAARSFDAKIEAKTAEVEKAVEAFAVDHNLDMSTARMRLEKISPSFAKSAEDLADLHNQRSHAALKAQHDLELAWREHQGAMHQAKVEAQQATDKAASAALAKRAPEDVQLEAMAKGYAIAHKCDVVEAYGALMETSPEARDLYSRGEARKNERRAGL